MPLASRRLTAALVLVTAALLTSPVATAEETGPLGGPQLGSTGIVVNFGPGVPALPAVSAASFVIADADSGAVLAAKNPHGKFAPASTLKTLTAITLLPLLDPNETVEATQEAANVDGTKVGVVAGNAYKVGDLMTAMLMMSGNDASHLLAVANGGLESTLEDMNAQAARLRALDTVARTPHGLDAEGQVSSAYDLALINRRGLELPEFRRMLGLRRAQFPGPEGTTYEISSHNKLLPTYAGMIGGKNGYTKAARASYVGAATRDGHTIIVALMRSEPNFWPDAQALLDWGFAADGVAKPVGQLVDPVPPAPEPTSSAGPQPVASSSAGAGVAAGDSHGGGSRGLATVVRGFAAIVVVLGVAVVGLRLRAVRRRRRRRTQRYISSVTRF
jgi:D-alanyl-D-alanine carboxypeptidase (penicillin-binding protein 5/6)